MKITYSNVRKTANLHTMNKQALLRPIFLALALAATSLLAQSPPATLAQIKVAADAGDAASQDKLAETFVLRADSSQAEVWYRKAAEQGFAHAQGRLGNMLLMRSRMAVSATPAARAAMSEEAVHWMTLAANQGDKRGQADFADICLEGKLVKLDLVEAYKWGELASKGSMIDVATFAGRSCRDAATLKMDADQIAEAQKRAAAFTPHQPKASEMPEPSWVTQIKLNAISGATERRLAMINGKTVQKGDQASLTLGAKTVTVRCIEIRQSSVLISIDGLDGTREVRFR
jgi:Sel1 repeat